MCGGERGGARAQSLRGVGVPERLPCEAPGRTWTRPRRRSQTRVAAQAGSGWVHTPSTGATRGDQRRGRQWQGGANGQCRQPLLTRGAALEPREPWLARMGFVSPPCTDGSLAVRAGEGQGRPGLSVSCTGSRPRPVKQRLARGRSLHARLQLSSLMGTGPSGLPQLSCEASAPPRAQG